MIDLSQFFDSIFEFPQLSIFRTIFAGAIILITISAFIQFFIGAFTSLFK